MITIVQGVPGGGKSLFAIEKIWWALCNGRHVWTNIDLVAYWPILIVLSKVWRAWLWTPEAIMRRALRLRGLYHRIHHFSELPWDTAPEGSRLLVLDEVQLMFNARDASREKRGSQFLAWFSQSRKIGFETYLIAQDHKMIDAQIRSLAETLVTSSSMVRWCANFMLISIPIGPVVTWMLGPIFFRRASMLSMKGLRLWNSLDLVPQTISRIFNTRQMYRADGGFRDEFTEWFGYQLGAAPPALWSPFAVRAADAHLVAVELRSEVLDLLEGRARPESEGRARRPVLALVASRCRLALADFLGAAA
jgi:hypothetical protein